MDINGIKKAVQAIETDIGSTKEAAAMMQNAYELHRIADALEDLEEAQNNFHARRD